MGLEQTFVTGKWVGVSVGPAAAVGAVAVKPTAVTIAVDDATVTAGATTMNVTAASDVDVKKNTILEFAYGGTSVLVLVTADTTIQSTPTALAVDSVTGDVGSGIPAALTSDYEASFSGLFRLLGTEGSDFADNANTQTLNSVTYDSAYAGPSTDYPIVTSRSPGFSRTGRLKPRDYAWQQVRAASRGDRELWVEHITPDENNNPAVKREGRAKILNYREPNPAGGIVDAQFDIRFVGPATETIISAPGS